MTDKEKRTVLAVFGELMKKDYAFLNTFLGLLTIEEMGELYNKLKYEDYCKAHGVSYEEMTEEDFVRAMLMEV